MRVRDFRKLREKYDRQLDAAEPKELKMTYLKFKYKDTEVTLTPETIRDIRQQLAAQIKQMRFGELIETIEAAGLSTKNLLALLKKE